MKNSIKEPRPLICTEITYFFSFSLNHDDFTLEGNIQTMKSKDVDIYPIHNRVKFCLNAFTCFYQPISIRIINEKIILQICKNQFGENIFPQNLPCSFRIRLKKLWAIS